MEPAGKKRSLAKKILRIVLKTFLSIFLLLILIIILIQTGPVQNFIRKKAVAYLERKLHTKVEVGKIYVGFPKKVVVENIYMEDQQHDTLIAAKSLKVNIGLFKLIFHGDIAIDNVELSDATLKVKRQLPDTLFNYQFIVDAFSPKSTTPSAPDTAASPIELHNINLDRVRIVYNDIITGNDIQASIKHLDTKFNYLDPVKQYYNLSRTNVDGLVASVYQIKPLANPKPLSKDIEEASAPLSMHVSFDATELKNVSLDYRNDVSAMYSRIDAGLIKVVPQDIDLINQSVLIQSISIDHANGSVRFGKKAAPEVIVKQVAQEIESRAVTGWRMGIASFDITNSNLQYDDENSIPLRNGMDYAHIKGTDLNLNAKDFLFAMDTVAANITDASFKEQSGFSLEKLQADFLYSSTQSYIHDLYIKTPGSEIKRSADLKYASIEALQKDIGNLYLDVDFDHSKLLVQDILVFAPFLSQQPALANPAATWYINSRIKGRIADLNIQSLQIQGLADTKIDVSGTLKGLPDMNALTANLVIRNITSSKRDMNLLIPRGVLPKTITLPGSMSMNGTIHGNPRDMRTDLSLRTDLGNAAVKGSFGQLTDPLHFTYNATINTSAVNLPVILQNPAMPSGLTAVLNVKGSGTDPKTATATFDGIVQSTMYEKYNYRNIKVTGNLANANATMNAGIDDPNIHVSLNMLADLSTTYPAIKIDGMIDSIKTQALNLTPDPFVIRGKIDGNFPVTNPDDLQGKLLMTQVLIVQRGQRVQLDSVQLIADKSERGHSIQLISDVASAKLDGQYQLTELGTIFQQAIQPYFAVQSPGVATSTHPYDFTLNAYVLNSPVLKTFIPGFERMDSVSVQSKFSDKNGWSAFINAPLIIAQGNTIRGLQINAGTNQDKLDVKATLKGFKNGTALALDNATVTATLADNNIDFVVNIKDKKLKDKYNIAGSLLQPQNSNYQFGIKPEGLLLNYEPWTIAAGNKIVVTENDIRANNFTLTKNGQQLTINSVSTAANAPLEFKFDNFRLVTLTGFVQSDSTLADGLINGKIVFNDLMRDPIFAGDLTVNDLRIKNDTVGNVKILVDNKVQDTYAANVTLTGHGNDAKLVGNYYMKPGGASNFDFNLDLLSLPMTTLQAFSNGALRESSGSVNGKFKVTGNIAKPMVNGELNFNKTAFNFSMFNSYYRIDDEKLLLDGEGFHFNDFAIRDSANNPLTINGTAGTKNFFNYNFNMHVRANNFRALNSTKKDNKLFYGQLYFNTNLDITGTELAPKIDGQLTVNEKTKMTVVLPQAEPGVVSREGIIEFVDMDAPLNDSLFLTANYDSVNTSSFVGADVSVNIDVNKAADFTMIIDEGNGDFLNIKGEAQINATINPAGQITMAGSYELEEGAYELTFNLIHRKFNIQKGSRITWGGEPTDADVDIKATYTANTAPLDLVKNLLADDVTTPQRNTYLQKLPFDVILSMQGKLLKPIISFDIILPENKNYAVSNDIIVAVRTRLDQLRQEQGEMNKQVFALLLLNRFVTENPFASSGSSTSAGTYARQSVSKLLTEQLNQLAGSLIQGVNLNFDVQSSEDYTTGERADRTDLNVGLSKKLLNDRLTVTVGSNFELEGPQNSKQQGNNIAGNVAIDYKLSNDGRYLLRAYRKNEYEGVIDGYLVETGVGFIITLDYNHFREILRGKKMRQRQNANATKTTTTTEDPNKKTDLPAKDETPPTKQPADPAKKENE